MSNSDLDVAKKLGLTGVKIYWRRAGQVKIELNWLYDLIPVLATFMGDLYKVYNGEKVN